MLTVWLTIAAAVAGAQTVVVDSQTLKQLQETIQQQQELLQRQVPGAQIPGRDAQRPCSSRSTP